MILYMQIFYETQKVVQCELLQNTPLRGQCAKNPNNYNSMHYHTSKQTSCITPTTLQTLPLKTNLTKPPIPLTLIPLPASVLVPTLIPRTQFFPTPTPWLRATTTQTPSNPHQKDTISVGSTLPYNHPPALHSITTRKDQPIAKIKPNTDDKLSFLFKKMTMQHQLNTAGANGSPKRRKQVYCGKTKINQWLLTKYMDGHEQHNRSRPTKITITSRDDHQQGKQLQPTRMIRTAKCNKNQQHLILHRYLDHHHQGGDPGFFNKTLIFSIKTEKGNIASEKTTTTLEEQSLMQCGLNLITIPLSNLLLEIMPS